MRYQNWDVLIFPGGSSIPIQEFRTASFAVQEAAGILPTLVTYVPSLAQGVPFAISIHSWDKPVFSRDVPLYTNKHLFAVPAWGVKIVIDGADVSSLAFTEQAAWPQVINSRDDLDLSGKVQPLPFPPFYRSVLSRRHWDIQDHQGRINIVISEGLRSTVEGTIKYQPIRNVVCFSFHPAPLEYLERCNIAWPNTLMFKHPYKPNLPHNSALKSPSSLTDCTFFEYLPTYTHLPLSNPRFRDSALMPAPPRPPPMAGTISNAHPFPDATTWSSRSTSFASYEGFWPDFEHQSTSLGLDGTAADSAKNNPKRNETVRLPSDQLRQIISAIACKSLPRADSTDNVRQKVESEASRKQPAPRMNFRDARDASLGDQDEREKGSRCRNTSDVTMHSDYPGFPQCTDNDPVTGNIIHTTPSKEAFLEEKAQTVKADFVLSTGTNMLSLNHAKTTGDVMKSNAGSRTSCRAPLRRMPSDAAINLISGRSMSAHWPSHGVDDMSDKENEVLVAM